MQGIFVSISATTNGGLDITGDSLVPYAKDYFVQNDCNVPNRFRFYWLSSVA